MAIEWILIESTDESDAFCIDYFFIVIQLIYKLPWSIKFCKNKITVKIFFTIN